MTNFRIGGGWGSHISWFNVGTQVYGHLGTHPKIGDHILAPMESGKTGVYRVRSVDRPGDPADMFFARVVFVGYEGEELSPEP
jgi:hypothetical protein